jgi:DNA-binding transcriptional LysR family regulator
MDLEKIRTFCLLMEHKTLVETAKITKLSISGVQRQIATLEEALGIKLFQKQQRHLKPTPEGDRFYQHCVKMLEGYDHLIEGLSQPSDELMGELFINATGSSIGSWLTEDIANFIKQNPTVRFVLVADDRPVQQIKNECDVFIRPKIEDLGDLEQRYLRTFSFLVYASKDYLKEHGVPQRPEDLVHHKVIAYGKLHGLAQHGLNWHLDYLPHDFRNMVYINSGLGILKAVERSVGIGVISSDDYSQVPEDLVRLFPDVTPHTVDMYMIYPRNTLKRNHLDSLYAYLRKKYGGSK